MPNADKLKLPSWHHVNTVEEMEAFFMSILPAMREAAKQCGYAIGFHGSAKRDFDLIAVPWAEIYSTPNALAEAIQKAACGFHHATYQWETKPNGRIATAFPICWTHGDMGFDKPSLGHIDLSVMTDTRPAPRVGGDVVEDTRPDCSAVDVTLSDENFPNYAPLPGNLLEAMAKAHHESFYTHLPKFDPPNTWEGLSDERKAEEIEDMQAALIAAEAMGYVLTKQEPS